MTAQSQSGTGVVMVGVDWSGWDGMGELGSIWHVLCS